MKTQVAYYTKSGNTKKLADAIGSQLDCKVSDIDTPITGDVDVLFLGASVYKFGIDKKVLAFINNLDPKSIGSVVIFSTSAMSDSGYPILVNKLTNAGIKVSEKHFYCRGQFMFANKNLPNADNLTAVKEFAQNIIDSTK